MMAHEFSDEVKPSEKDGRIYLELNDTILPDITLDSSYLLAIVACNDISCRNSVRVALSKCNISGPYNVSLCYMCL